jgi:hypothetical protein
MKRHESFDELEEAIKIGRHREREAIVKLIKPHRITGKSVGGFLGVCSCGEAMDDYQEHLLELIEREQR